MTNNNMAVWDVLSKSDPSQTKKFKRAGGFSGTALKPMWVWKMLTEKFGAMGVGWGCKKPEYQLVPTEIGTLVYCTVEAWHDNKDNVLWGVGGDKVSYFTRDGTLFIDDEAFKKAFTDALMNAFKFIGAGADIHMGLFDDSKYVAEVAEEFQERAEEEAERQPRRKLDGPITSITGLEKALRAAKLEMDKAKDSDAFEAVVTNHRPLFKQAMRDAKSWMDGDEETGFEGFTALVAARRAEFNPPSGPEADLKAEFPESTDGFRELIAGARECEDGDALDEWFEANQPKLYRLDDAEQASVRFQIAEHRKAIGDAAQAD